VISGDWESVVHITKGDCNGVGLAEVRAYLSEVMPALLLRWHPARYRSSHSFLSLPLLFPSIPFFFLASVGKVFETVLRTSFAGNSQCGNFQVAKPFKLATQWKYPGLGYTHAAAWYTLAALDSVHGVGNCMAQYTLKHVAACSHAAVPGSYATRLLTADVACWKYPICASKASYELLLSFGQH